MSVAETEQMTAAETSALSQQKKAQVRSWLTKVPAPSGNIKFCSKWVESRRFGLELGPEACQDCSGAFGMGLTHSKGPSPAKKVKNVCPSRPRISRSIHNPWYSSQGLCIRPDRRTQSHSSSSLTLCHQGWTRPTCKHNAFTREGWPRQYTQWQLAGSPVWGPKHPRVASVDDPNSRM